MDLGTIGAGLNILGGIGGLMGRSAGGTASNNQRRSMLGMAAGAREAAERFGFNPLTMLQTGGGGGLASGGIAPLASVELISGGLQDLAAAKKNEQDAQTKAAVNSAEQAYRAAEKSAPVSAVLSPKPTNVSAIGAHVSAAPKMSQFDPDFVGPLRAVPVWSALSNEWVDLDPRVANQLRKERGDSFMAEDVEAIGGDIMAEAYGLGGVVQSGLSGRTGGWIYTPRGSSKTAPSVRSAPPRFELQNHLHGSGRPLRY